MIEDSRLSDTFEMRAADSWLSVMPCIVFEAVFTVNEGLMASCFHEGTLLSMILDIT